MSMNFNGSKPAPVSEPEPKKKKNHTKTIAGIVIIGFITAFAAIGIAQYEQKHLNNILTQKPETSSISSDLISGEYDNVLREKCIERLNSYGLGNVPEGSINLCVDTAKAIAYSELNK